MPDKERTLRPLITEGQENYENYKQNHAEQQP